MTSTAPNRDEQLKRDIAELKERLDSTRGFIEELKHSIYEYNRKNVQVVRRPKAGSSLCDLIMKVKEPVPLKIRQKAGMIANEIRSCLDGLASSLAVHNGADTKHVFFPIAETEANFHDRIKKLKYKISESHRNIIASLKPWKNENWLLWAMHEADINRKHVRLGACSSATKRTTVGPIVMGGNDIRVGQLAIGDEIVGSNISYASTGRTLDESGELLLMTNVSNDFKIKNKFSIVYSGLDVVNEKDVIDALSDFVDESEDILVIFEP